MAKLIFQFKCPRCEGIKIWKDGFRKTNYGYIQRYQCKNCSYRFSKSILRSSSECSERSQICVSRVRKAKNLAMPKPQIEDRPAGATKEAKSLILEYAWQIKRRGLAPSTIKQRVYRLKKLAEKGANLLDPETVTTVLAVNEWTESNKKVFIVAYKNFTKTFNLQWIPPKTRVQRKLLFIPTEAEIDQLIAGCGQKTATFLQVLKETAARGCEAAKLKWTEIDEKSNTIRINNPVKGSLARIIKVKPKTIAMINSLARTGEYIFNTKIYTIRKIFTKQRKRISRTLQNPRLMQIHFYTFRHWKATMEFHRTKNILYVKQLLGHKNWRTQRFIHTS